MNTEKMSIEEFRSIKKQMNDLILESNSLEEKDSEKLELIYQHYLDLQNVLTSHDLSDITFEEWKDMSIFGDHVDFSKTGANIDFNYVYFDGDVDFTGCNLRNNIDKGVTNDNSNMTLSDNFDETVKKAYNTRTLDIPLLAALSSEQLEELKKKDLDSHLDGNIKNGNMFHFLGLDKMILLYQHSTEEYNCVYKLFESSQDRWNFYRVGNSLAKLCKADISEIKDCCFSYFKDKILTDTLPLVKDYYPDMFVAENQDLFLINVDLPDDVRERYFSRQLSLKDLITYSNEFKNIPVDYFLDFRLGVYQIAKSYGIGTFQKFVSKYSQMFSQINDSHYFIPEEFQIIFSNIRKNKKEKDNDLEKAFFRELRDANIDLLMEAKNRKKALPNWLQTIGYEVKDNIETIDDLINYSEMTVLLNEKQKKLIDSLGIDNIKRFEEDTGFFSHIFSKSDKSFSSFANLLSQYSFHSYMSMFNKRNDDYTKFTDVFADLLNVLRVKGILHIIGDYDFIQGEFREKHPKIFIDYQAPEELKNIFYSRQFTATDIRNHPEYIPYLLDVDLASSIYLTMDLKGSLGYSDLVKSYILKHGNEKFLKLVLTYGEKLNNIFIEDPNDTINDSVEFEKLIRKAIMEKLLTSGDKYYDLIDNSDFVKECPNLFLDENVDSSIKDKFYQKDFTVQELLSKSDYYVDMFKDTIITLGLSEEYNWIGLLFNEKGEFANYYRLIVLAQYERMKDDSDLAEEFKNYLLDNSSSVRIDNIKVLGDIINSLSKTNSTALHSIRKSLVTQLLQLDNPMNSYRKIEQIFLRNNLPLYGKMFYCFEILYPEFSKKIAGVEQFDFSEMGRLSPELKDDSLAKVKRYDGKDSKTDLRFQIIYNDLIRIAVKSNSLDLRKYLDSLEMGQDLYYEVIETKRELADLSESELETLSIFETHLEVIYRSSKKGQEENLELENYDLLTKLKVLEEKFGPTKRHDLKDRIVRMFAYSAGYHSYQELRDDMKQSVKRAHERGISYAEELRDKRFTLEDFDFLRCIGDYQALGGSLDNGNFSNEFLSTILGTSDSDTTPLDIDWTLVFDNGDIYHSIHGTPTGFGYGNVYLVIKNSNPNIRVTRDSFGNLTEREYDPTTIEMFGTQVGEDWNGYETHWGSRTGIAMTDVDFILYKKSQMIDHEHPYYEDGNVNYTGSDSNSYDDLPAIKFEIARHGYYIPVVDFAGKLIFTVEEYNELRKQIQGLSYYEEGNYTFSNNLDLPPIGVNGFEYPNSADIITRIDDSRMEISHKRDRIFAELKEVFDKYGLEIKTKMDGDIRPGSVEIIDTGSTGRGTNEIGEGDFDLFLRLDSDIYNDENSLHLFCADIKRVLSKFSIDKKVETARGDLRYKGVHFSDDIVVDLDISYDRKTDKVLYTTDECISDRLSTLKSLDEEKYQKVLANIILAKRVLKDAGVYKSKNSGTPQGGLGGVGVENWILEHGGSFIDAARSFCEVAEGKSFDEFKSLYTVWDFGENHTGERKEHYLHDNFVADNMDEHGYQRMVALLKEYIKKYEISLMISNKADESLMDISTHSL